jgi:hypothetical protein
VRRFTPEEIVQLLPEQRENLRRVFGSTDWFPPFDGMLGELFELARVAPNQDSARVSELETRVATFVTERRLKGISPFQWMVASLKPEAVAKP